MAEREYVPKKLERGALAGAIRRILARRFVPAAMGFAEFYVTELKNDVGSVCTRFDIRELVEVCDLPRLHELSTSYGSGVKRFYPGELPRWRIHNLRWLYVDVHGVPEQIAEEVLDLFEEYLDLKAPDEAEAEPFLPLSSLGGAPAHLL
ncbi:MAG TPA: hypothetical protein VHF22_00440, partial [Planctomycetota bacterium]|nr:hypothetical protein [Planctomycetota bacterium]